MGQQLLAGGLATPSPAGGRGIPVSVDSGSRASPLYQPDTAGAWSQPDPALSDARGGESKVGAWSQPDPAFSDSKVSPKFIEALERLEAALSQNVPLQVSDDATAALLTQGALFFHCNQHN
ncbi:unnamed protein product [Polarella glacialis]|uniref:Uncharacterized protein n=1 Tax=Polarella glacialis TaxID=89957 RepID=A0A813GM79_POLGL|nr:unnamed protein product [Polarella glacialis]